MSSHAHSDKRIRSGEAGFTLVELSIALSVIGLIIGGVLKGQEVIRSAQLKSTVQQIQAFQAAHIAFKDKYGGLPSDLIDANAVLGAAVIERRNTVESLLYWRYLAAGGFITRIELDACPSASFGAGLPAAAVGDCLESEMRLINGRLSPWLYLVDRPISPNGPISGAEMAQLDKRYDDGRPGTGWIRGLTGACLTNNTGTFANTTSEYVQTAENYRASFEIE